MTDISANEENVRSDRTKSPTDEMGQVHDLRPRQLECNGCGRLHDPENPRQAAKALVLYFNRAPSDEEMRFIHESAARAANFAGGS